jgi:ParB-like chromosome segregation protein Spo0J
MVKLPPVKDNRVVPLDRCLPHPDNFRQHPDEQISDLQASLMRFGPTRSIVVQDGPDGYLIVAGHGLVEAAKRLGITELRADIIPADWTSAQVKGYLIADNSLIKKASDDEVLLARLLDEQKNAGYDLASLGSDEESLRQMLESLGDEILGSDEDQESKPDVQFKEYDESIEEGMDTELCQQCGKLCLKSGKGKK